MSTTDIRVNWKLLARRLLFGAVAYILIRIKGLVTLPLMTRLLGPSGMGAVSLTGVTANMLWPVFTLGTTYALPVKILAAKDSDELRKLYGSTANLIAVVTSLALGLLLTVNALGWGRRFIRGFAPYLLATEVFIAVTLAKELALMVPKVLQRTRIATSYELIIEYGGAIASVGVLLLGKGTEAVIWAMSVAAIPPVFILLIKNFREFGYYRGIDRAALQPLLIMGLPVIPVILAQGALQGVDQYFIAFYHGQASLGAYSVTYTLASPTLGLLAVLSYVYLPTLSVLLKRGWDHFERFFLLSVRFTTIVLGLWLLVTISLGRDLVAFLAGGAFADAVSLLPIVVFGYIALTLTSLFQQIPVVTTHRTIHMAYNYGIAMAANLLLNFLLIPRFALMGAAVATAIGYLLLLLLMMVSASSHFVRGKLFVASLTPWVPIILGTPVAYWVAHLTIGFAGRLLAMLVLSLLYGVTGWLCGAISAQDLRDVKAWDRTEDDNPPLNHGQ